MIDLYKEFFTINDLRMRGVPLTEDPHAVPRTAFKILEIVEKERTKDCIWYDLVCRISPSWESFNESVIVDEDGRFTVRTVIPAPGAVVEEKMIYRSVADGIMYTYLGIMKVQSDGMVATCAKISMSDQKVYEDSFHLLSPFTSLYMSACVGNGRAMISSSTGMRNTLRIYR